ncbi:RNA dependent RNA polymerase-domain-containing protein [Chiua virens]|nr:RNA dependent RNA polymerase-domain-containing protein [Chiua virens]
MEFDIRNVPYKADEWEVTTAIATQVLHVCPGPFVPEPQERPPNFQVKLNPSPAGGVQNDGTGTLTLTRILGKKFQRLSYDGHISVQVKGKKLKFYLNKNSVSPSLALELEKAPFIDPDIARDRQKRVSTLCDPFYISHVQIGTYYHPQGACDKTPRSFSVEWDRDLSERSKGLLFFEYEHKCLRVQLGDQSYEDTFHNIVIRFSSIHKMAMGWDFGNPFVCFDLFTPPMLQEEQIFRTLSNGARTERKFRHRLGSLSPAHEIVAPYAHQLRILLLDIKEWGFDDILKRFQFYCQTALLRPPRELNIDANGRQNLFCQARLTEIAAWLRSPDLASNWRVAFQIEALLHNGIANTVDLMELRPRIERLVHSHRDAAGDVMRRFVETAARRPVSQRISECFEIALEKSTQRPRTSPSRGRLSCHHVTFTPTRLLLEGPIITQSNRIVREYEGYEDHFIRVDFREEDRLSYKWDRDVDGASFLQERVGTLLKEGFNLAGRHFKFLGYSSSALKEHAVWYFNSFQHRTKGWVTAQTIRDSLGNFSKVMKSPSKYGARMAQAFSATDPSVRVGKDQWSRIPDIIDSNGTNFTDGVGTISPGLADRIWAALCEDNPSLSLRSVVPSAYQIRFLGCKGVVSVDKRLEGVHMCLRDSMIKFEVPWEDYGTIEIANYFGRPGIPYLNRPLVMLLENRGAPREVFLQLQKDAVADARMAHDSAALYAKLLDSNKLCYNFRLAEILRRLNALGLELKPSHLDQPLDTAFFARLRACAINHVLRSVKHEARLQIPNSHSLVGVADEGPAYVKQGLKNLYCLPQGKIFACVQSPEDEKPRYLQGMCLVFRNPVIHPGDVQRVYALGPPPKECAFGHLKNVVVFPSIGTWSLPNGLAGGDLDGDLYTIIQYGDLLAPEHCDPASYPAVKPYELDRDSTVDDVCNFIVEYINSDVVGLVASKHLVIADQSTSGVFDPDCLMLAEMHSSAVDYPKNGNKVDISNMPRALIRFKPDWQATEVDSPGPSDHYQSTTALGYLYRNITLEAMPDTFPQHQGMAEAQPIFKTLLQLVRRHLPGLANQRTATWINTLHATYCEELRYISGTYALSKIAGSQLREEELVIGTILANSTQKGYRNSRMQAMRENMGFLVHDVKDQLVGRLEELSENALKEKLAIVWSAWKFSLDKASASAEDNFGTESFGLIGLGLVLECLDRLGSLPPL